MTDERSDRVISIYHAVGQCDSYISCKYFVSGDLAIKNISEFKRSLSITETILTCFTCI